jgi:hypothetical protein
MRANMPGVNKPFAFSNTARPRIVPVDDRSRCRRNRSGPWPVELLLVEQFQLHGSPRPRGSSSCPGTFDARIAEERGLIEGEFEPDRIDRHDGREHRRVTRQPGQIARTRAVADAANWGRRNFEIELTPATAASGRRMRAPSLGLVRCS